MRTAYRRARLDAHDLGDDPLATVAAWIEDAAGAGMVEPNAMALATSDEAGRASVRMVLCKGVDARGLAFFTNLESRKGRELAGRPWAAATFWWDRTERQVRVEGPVEPVPAGEADAYFATRPRGSRVSAWASPQSRPLADRAELELRAEEAEARFAAGDEVPRPPYWGGYRIVPARIEFWQGRDDRLHDRIRFEWHDAVWRVERLAP